MGGAAEPVNLFEFEPIAKECLPKAEYDYIAGGAMDEISVRRNRLAFEAIALRPRVLTGVSRVDLATTVLGTEVSFPVLLAPCGGLSKAHPDGDLAAARAAGASGTIMAVSANASYPFEEVARVATGPLWAQMYPFLDRQLTERWVRRAEEAEYTALCVTLDTHWPYKRERDIRNNYTRTGQAPNYADAKMKSVPAPEQRRGSFSLPVNPAATWEDLAWLKSLTHLPVIAKGIMSGEDAALCVEHGIDAIIVSNHGGRNLDNTLATIEVLPEVVAAVKGRSEVFLDGGVRRGGDVVKALALGAKAVLIGRPFCWGLAVGGQSGVAQVLEILRQEMEITMARCGAPTIESIDASVIIPAPRLDGAP